MPEQQLEGDEVYDSADAHMSGHLPVRRLFSAFCDNWGTAVLRGVPLIVVL
jgi:hypothetical protein